MTATAKELLESLAHEGGILVTTFDGEICVARTLLQLDGDVVTTVTQEFLDREHLQCTHLDTIRQTLQQLSDGVGKVRRWEPLLRAVHWAALALTAGAGGAGAWHLFGGLAETGAITAAGSMASASLSHLAGRWIGGRIRRWLVSSKK